MVLGVGVRGFLSIPTDDLEINWNHRDAVNMLGILSGLFQTIYNDANALEIHKAAIHAWPIASGAPFWGIGKLLFRHTKVTTSHSFGYPTHLAPLAGSLAHANWTPFIVGMKPRHWKD